MLQYKKAKGLRCTHQLQALHQIAYNSKMKTFIVVCLTVLVVASAKYTDKYDNINVEEIVSNCRLFVPYIKCILGDKKKCTKEGLELKSHIVEALQNKCAECTDKQKEETKHIIGILIKTQTMAWEKLRALYDPKNEYYNKYQKDLNEAAAAGNYAQYKECDLETERAVE